MAARIPIARVGRLSTSVPISCARPRPQFMPRFAARRREFSISAAARIKKYTEDHEWIELAEDGSSMTLGISKYAANALGDVIYVELPKEGLEIGNGDAIGAVESVKSASDILTPVAGKVIDANSILEEKPSLLNNDPEGEGWIAKLQVDGDAVATVEGLMDEEGYKAFTDESS